MRVLQLMLTGFMGPLKTVVRHGSQGQQTGLSSFKMRTIAKVLSNLRGAVVTVMLDKYFSMCLLFQEQLFRPSGACLIPGLTAYPSTSTKGVLESISLVRMHANTHIQKSQRKTRHC